MILLTSIVLLVCWAGTDAATIFGATKSYDNVLQMTSADFDDMLKQYKSVLVNFYPSESLCPSCDHVREEFAETARILIEDNESDIKLGEVDISQAADLKARFNIKSYPVIKLFTKGEHGEVVDTNYIGSWHSHAIVAWAKKKNGHSAYRVLHTTADIEDFTSENQAAVIGTFKNPEGPEAKAFIVASQRVLDDGVNFGLVIPDEETLAREFSSAETNAKIVVMKQFDELVVVYKDKPYDSVDEIVQFVRLRAFPYVVDFNPGAEGIRRTFGHATIHESIALFASKSSIDFHGIYNEFRVTAERLRPELHDKLIFAYVDTGKAENDEWINYFEVDKEECPLVMVIVLDGRKLRFKLKREEVDGQIAPITSKGIEKLVRDYLADLLSPDLHSYEKDEL